MKKMIFSAVALVAFSFAGMANEVKEKKGEVKPTETKKVEIIEVVKEKDCFLEADWTLILYDQLYGEDFLSDSEDEAFMNIYIALKNAI